MFPRKDILEVKYHAGVSGYRKPQKDFSSKIYSSLIDRTAIVTLEL